MVYIEWLIDAKSTYEVLIEGAVTTALKAEGIDDELEISVNIVDNNEIQGINKEQRGIDQPTDVLSFPMINYDGLTSVQQAIEMEKPNPDSNRVYLGDVILSWDKVVEQSSDYGHSLERELSFLVVHSVLHLLGYDHMTPEEEKLMIGRQQAIMTALGIER